MVELSQSSCSKSEELSRFMWFWEFSVVLCFYLVHVACLFLLNKMHHSECKNFVGFLGQKKLTSNPMKW